MQHCAQLEHLLSTVHTHSHETRKLTPLVPPPSRFTHPPHLTSLASAPPHTQLARPRRASRAPVRLGQQDENAAAAVPRAAGKAAVLAGKPALAQGPAQGKVVLQQQQQQQAVGAQRKAFGDVSNAQGQGVRVRLARSLYVARPGGALALRAALHTV